MVDPDFIGVVIADDDYTGRACKAIVRTSTIVRIVQKWYEVGSDGSRHRSLSPAEQANDGASRTLEHHFQFYDSAGNEYDTLNCDSVGREYIAQLWQRFAEKA